VGGARVFVMADWAWPFGIGAAWSDLSRAEGDEAREEFTGVDELHVPATDAPPREDVEMVRAVPFALALALALVFGAPGHGKDMGAPSRTGRRATQAFDHDVNGTVSMPGSCVHQSRGLAGEPIPSQCGFIALISSGAHAGRA
jgi:hypothetical protein